MLRQSLKRAYYFYVDGFRSMKVGKKLWKLIVIKLLVMFALVYPLLHLTFGDKTKESVALSNLFNK